MHATHPLFKDQDHQVATVTADTRMDPASQLAYPKIIQSNKNRKGQRGWLDGLVYWYMPWILNQEGSISMVKWKNPHVSLSWVIYLNKQRTEIPQSSASMQKRGRNKES